MKLKKKIYKIDTTFFKKFLNCSHRSLGKGDYVRLNSISLNPKKKGLNNLRLSKRTVLLLKKKRTGNTCTFVVSARYKQIGRASCRERV